MAEAAANLTFTSQNKPSIFEIVAQKSLNDTLYPALQNFCLFLSTASPKNFNWLNKYYDETFLALNAVLQYHYLKYYDATFSEKFYGLQRVLFKGDIKLSDKKRWLSLVFTVLVPYFKRKIEEKLEMYKLQNADGYLGQNLDAKFKRLLLFVQSSLEVGYGVWLINNYLKYMGNSKSPQLPPLEVLNLKLIYSVAPPDESGFWSALFRGQISLKDINMALLHNATTSAFELSAFFLQFIQAWNVETSNRNITSLPNVPPPALDPGAQHYEGRCPLCKQHWKIPTVLPVSGYVFCFSCILRHLREHQQCPVTLLPAKPLDIVRLYDSVTV